MGFFPNFANEIRKLWGFSEILQMKMENYGVFICKNPIIRNFEKNYGVFPNENPIIFDFHLEKKIFDFFFEKVPKIEESKKHIFRPLDPPGSAIKRFLSFWPIFSPKKWIFRENYGVDPPTRVSYSGTISRDLSKYAI